MAGFTKDQLKKFQGVSLARFRRDCQEFLAINWGWHAPDEFGP
jgi:hypothetical protein